MLVCLFRSLDGHPLKARVLNAEVWLGKEIISSGLFGCNQEFSARTHFTTPALDLNMF